MISAFLDFVDWLVTIVESLFQFLGTLIDGLLNLVQALPQAISMLTSSIGYLPSTLAAFATLTVTICVLFIVLGREGGAG